MIPLDSTINVTSKGNVALDIMWDMNCELVHISQVSPKASISMLNEECYLLALQVGQLTVIPIH